MNTSARRAFVIAFLGLLAASATPTTAVAQAAYPSKTVKIVVPYPPGGTNDSVARVLAQRLADRLGQPFIVENKAGASGNLGAEFVARAPADGYTLILVTMGHTIHPSLYRNLRYDIRTDLAPITSLTTGPALLMVNPNMGVNSLKDLIALAKSKPGALNFSSAGNGSSTHLATEYLSERAGIKMTHIPFNGSAPAMMDVIAGNSQVVMDMMFSATPQVKGGKLKAIAQTGAKRSPAMPDVPTVAEAGLPGFDVSVWNGLMAPAGTPKEVIAKLNAEIKRELDSPEFKERLAAQGYEPAWSTPEQFDKLIASDIERWAKVVKTSGAKAE
ncbi:tripartite-type tricarboxylate transporter receptor subunit TctC [Variovorax beijingensis]|uniref:Tripartite-type tricarboxylate transporter receptor subunit TctC n=1 Tax=Variovorax beijingensis TaxID=2496117 RepID=A0A561BDI1_9BURK|nr:tripartite tricarboxylate transporter substrate binding protein [Variovorax beijingensis]TWD76878.1 tripartite-type tricarboxylate transporter receptor subunit TctC [Variovorax beijingensis]